MSGCQNPLRRNQAARASIGIGMAPSGYNHYNKWELTPSSFPSNNLLGISVGPIIGGQAGSWEPGYQVDTTKP